MLIIREQMQNLLGIDWKEQIKKVHPYYNFKKYFRGAKFVGCEVINEKLSAVVEIEEIIHGTQQTRKFQIKFDMAEL